MGHQWFAEYDFEMLYHRQIEPPWKPELNAITDSRYFSNTFTDIPRALTPDSELNFEAVRNYPDRNTEQFVTRISIPGRRFSNEEDLFVDYRGVLHIRE